MPKFYLIKSSKYPSDVGDILSVKEKETIENELKRKRLTRNDIIELSALEYKYYDAIMRPERIQRYEKGTFKDICELTPGDKCKINNKYLPVQILKRDDRYDGIHFKCKLENGDDCDIPASSIEEIIKFDQGIYVEISDFASSINRQISKKSDSANETLSSTSNNSTREMELINQYFLDLFKYSINVDLEIRIVKDLVQMKNKRFIKSIIECKDHPLKLDVHQYLIPLLIKEENIQLIKLILDNCDLTLVSSQTFLNLANLALKKKDNNLFDRAIENCQDKNILLENGETFLTNLFKEKYSEEQIDVIISRNIFDSQVINKYGKYPFELACRMAMASIVEKIIPKSLSISDKQNAFELIFEAEEQLEKLNLPLNNTRKIRKLINNVETSQTMECNICMSREKNVTLECNHLFCDVCSLDLVQCPICR